MKNMVTGNEIYPGRAYGDYSTHYNLSTLKIRYNKKKRRKAYEGVVNLPKPIKVTSDPVLF